VIIEPSGNAGLPFELKFLIALRGSARQHGVVLIFDAPSAFRRAGTGPIGIRPDFDDPGKDPRRWVARQGTFNGA
jgi:glutamate-1-semialdehyde aminotransferase